MTKKEFQECFDQHFDAIRNYLYYRSGNTELATDLAQDVFLRVWEKNIKYEQGRTKGLLYKMAGDLFISYTRRVKLQNDYLQSLPLTFKSIRVDDDIEYEELKKGYEKALANLPEKQRAVFLMNRMNGLTYKEIAECLTISVKAVEKRMSKALGKLRIELQLILLIICTYFIVL
ncbi:RNA polymerase sigma factor [Aureispira anguillae]|uniref:Sigma-70 family RNA polymerase sigma factor n=1 Tax=Aureispira anguillae TaxID=2864201 RepID=A0A915YG65_9BACT|nr:sigma-70 family RNA polymerase sigma factor [Aureispira anguillae]BDS12554.1 sigma-70 family RNA polymerase sigma factor [Aureispira anguillae]